MAAGGESQDDLVGGSVDLAFSWNAIDHVQDINLFTRQLFSTVSETGAAVISINCHSWRGMAWAFSTFDIEELHPYQMTAPMYERLFAACGRRLRERVVLDQEYEWFRSASIREGIDREEVGKCRSLKSAVWTLLDRVGVRRIARNP